MGLAAGRNGDNRWIAGNNEFLPNYTVRQMHRKMVKSELISSLISGDHIRPDMKIWPDFGRGRI